MNGHNIISRYLHSDAGVHADALCCETLRYRKGGKKARAGIIDVFEPAYVDSLTSVSVVREVVDFDVTEGRSNTMSKSAQFYDTEAPVFPQTLSIQAMCDVYFGLEEMCLAETLRAGCRRCWQSCSSRTEEITCVLQ